jgi:hypothetical protein
VLPGWFVYSFGLVLPFVETLIGIALVLGLFTRWALLAGSLLIGRESGCSLSERDEILTQQLAC